MPRPAEPPARVRALTRKRLRYGFLAGIALIALGQATAIGGILLPRLFIPGIVLVGLGLVVLAVAGAAAPWAEPDESSPAIRQPVPTRA